ncbi:MAG: radical SAM protein [Lachnospiraceae bacterium]|nr:radical SAM protein [Lachnospiraceae bacterium]
MEKDVFTNCRLCPRNCNVDRTQGEGFCKSGSEIKAARAALHFYEEPFLSGVSGSGAIFFSGCSLQCIYCQNKQISREGTGIIISVERLSEIFFELKDKGARNINLVTGTHFTPVIAKAIEKAKTNGLDLPIIWNSSGYEYAETLKMLEGLVDIYLPDFKTLDSKIAQRYFKAVDYPERAKEALAQMVKAAGTMSFDTSEQARKEFEEEGLMQKGVCVRHLVTPGNGEDSKAVIQYLYETYGDDIWISVMSQYTPMEPYDLPELNEMVSEEEYEEIVDFAIDLGVTNCMIQEGRAVGTSFIPEFNGEGIEK